jgi:hypothetical protein
LLLLTWEQLAARWRRRHPEDARLSDADIEYLFHAQLQQQARQGRA